MFWWMCHTACVFTCLFLCYGIIDVCVFLFFSAFITRVMPVRMASFLLAYIPVISLSNSFRRFEGMCTSILFVCFSAIFFTFYRA